MAIVCAAAAGAAGRAAAQSSAAGETFLRSELRVLGGDAFAGRRDLGARAGLAFDQIGGDGLGDEFGGGGAEQEEEMVRLIHKYVNADRPFEQAAPSIRNGAMRINENARLNLASVEDQLNWFQASGLVSDAITIDILVDKSFMEVF